MSQKKIITGTLVLLLSGFIVNIYAQISETNYDESKVPPYSLPDALIKSDGNKIKTGRQWKTQRNFWINLFSEYMYGYTPKKDIKLRFQTLDIKNDALNNQAIRKRVNIYIADYPMLKPIELLLYVPKFAKKPVPVFISLNYVGNHGITFENDIPLSERWMLGWVDKTNTLIVNNRATEKARGMQARRWPLEEILLRGYAVATAYYGDIEPDYANGWQTGIRSVLGDSTQNNNWGAIGAWAWGMSRMLDYIKTEPLVNASQAIALGHSRLGKAALWAGAQDERFAMVISNNSGGGGASLSRRDFGEKIENSLAAVPYWYCRNYANYRNRVNDLPFDQHILLSLAAPRYLYVASASKDLWADPRGEFLSTVETAKVYHLFMKKGLGTAVWPNANSSVFGDAVGYHLRDGVHDILVYDWKKFMDFADEKFRK
ncbi:glucuronyl esterase domain-containing protein [Runella slithyformis]|uniref:4-O-methyl-glucuronoyl methylesterase-like domain-containing protein n=1 Tax=Runella slithyformis (strain ATCC 29530 / DSM 19594 / LMG 11500 / NCIMB 11436 / LSU 4) TaxID=761193 RepID=A0A7U3ZM37_RUNSL|nr:hypothetical protein [Runella slithyformis]AEI49697.1 hypothetical protein Runsl_3325 [Runella slithyformis DSM 19594]